VKAEVALTQPLTQDNAAYLPLEGKQVPEARRARPASLDVRAPGIIQMQQQLNLLNQRR
jgi:hypothetical protein